MCIGSQIQQLFVRDHTSPGTALLLAERTKQPPLFIDMGEQERSGETAQPVNIGFSVWMPLRGFQKSFLRYKIFHH